MPPRPLHIAIVGYGTAGQAAALALARDGHRVEVFERAPQPGPVGAGFLLQPTGLSVLHALGLLREALRHGMPVHQLFGDTPEGRVVMDMRYADLDPRLFGLGLQRGALFEVLHGAGQGLYALHAGAEVEAVDPEAGRLVVAGGARHGPFDLVLAADGSASRLRAALGRPRFDQPYPWGALWCLLPAGAWAHPNALRQRYRGARRMIGLLPAGTRPGDPLPRLSFFWSLRRDEMDAWEARGMEAWRAELAALWPEARDVLVQLPGSASGLARASYRDAAPARWHRGRLVALGDCAHAMSPQLGQGVNMALLDALALRDALRAAPDTTAALARYAAQRAAHVAVYQRFSRWLTPLFQSNADALAWLRDRGFLALGRLPGGRGPMLRTLAGTQRGFFGQQPLPEGFAEVLGGLLARPPLALA